MLLLLKTKWRLGKKKGNFVIMEWELVTWRWLACRADNPPLFLLTRARFHCLLWGDLKTRSKRQYALLPDLGQVKTNDNRGNIFLMPLWMKISKKWKCCVDPKWFGITQNNDDIRNKRDIVAQWSSGMLFAKDCFVFFFCQLY